MVLKSFQGFLNVLLSKFSALLALYINPFYMLILAFSSTSVTVGILVVEDLRIVGLLRVSSSSNENLSIADV